MIQNYNLQDFSIQEILDAAYYEGKQFYRENNVERKYTSLDINNMVDGNNVEDFEIDYSPVIQNSKFSSDGKAFLSKFFSGLDNQSFNDYSSVKTYITRKEDSLMNNQYSYSIPQEEENTILTITSTARHSIYFWDKEYQGRDNYSFIGALGMGIADAIGGVGGWTGSDDDAGFWEKAKNAIMGAAGASTGVGGAIKLFEEVGNN